MRTNPRHIIWGILIFMAYPVFADFNMPDNPSYEEIPVYPLPNDSQKVVIPVDYAQAILLNPDAYQGIDAESVYQIELVFTRYPVDFSRWRTDYNWLLEQRLRSLFALDSALFDQEHIVWKYILQTDPQNEPQCMNFFHGFIISWSPYAKPQTPSDSLQRLIEENEDGKMLTDIIYGYSGKLKDSSVYKVFQRHPEWEDMLVVMDWTSSMYHNGASVMRWHREHLEKQAIQHLVVFNDGNGKPHGAKRIGRTGGIFFCQPNEIDDVIHTMVKAKEATLGGDAPENDLEALLKASLRLDDFDELVLIPDRNSSIRDITLIRYLKKPVHIILFKGAKVRTSGLGSSGKWVIDEWVHPHYLTLASMTGGSIHTATQDLSNLSEMKTGETVKFGFHEYIKMENGSFQRAK
jgi:hypothetical protein